MFVTKLTAVLKPCAAGMFGVPFANGSHDWMLSIPHSSRIDTTLNASTDSRYVVQRWSAEASIRRVR